LNRREKAKVCHNGFHGAWKSLSVVKQIQGFPRRFSRRLETFERREKANSRVFTAVFTTLECSKVFHNVFHDAWKKFERREIETQRVVKNVSIELVGKSLIEVDSFKLGCGTLRSSEGKMAEGILAL
jgi:hypothetical protein